jgi:hypothetical protein
VRYKDVLGLDVSVDDFALVDVQQGHQQLHQPSIHYRLRESLLALFDQLQQISTYIVLVFLT